VSVVVSVVRPKCGTINGTKRILDMRKEIDTQKRTKKIPVAQASGGNDASVTRLYLLI